jgi:hypothetical protein
MMADVSGAADLMPPYEPAAARRESWPSETWDAGPALRRPINGEGNVWGGQAVEGLCLLGKGDNRTLATGDRVDQQGDDNRCK